MDKILAFDILKILEMFLLSNILIFSYTQLFFGEIISSRESEVGSRESEVGSRKSEVGTQKSEVGSQSEVSRKSKVGSRNSEVRSRKWPFSATVRSL